MSAFTKPQKIELILLIGSLLIGFGGMVWSIYGSFAALETAENAVSAQLAIRFECIDLHNSWNSRPYNRSSAVDLRKTQIDLRSIGDCQRIDKLQPVKKAKIAVC